MSEWPGEPTFDLQPSHEADKPQDECGVVGLYAPGEDVAHQAYLALYALQHRGQEAAGIAVYGAEDDEIFGHKDLGLVQRVFESEHTLNMLTAAHSSHAIGHVRYGTVNRLVPDAAFRAAGPHWVRDAGVAFGSNGQLNNCPELAAEYGLDWSTYASDNELFSEVLAIEKAGRGSTSEALKFLLPKMSGAFSMVAMDSENLYAARDAHGFRPLVLGRTESGGWIAASETAALDAVRASYERDIEPGELVIANENGIESMRIADPSPRFCLFEYVYISRPDSLLNGHSINSARFRMGEALARVAPVEADLVAPVPESGNPSAKGYAAASGITLKDALVKNRYVGRTFITPGQQNRENGVHIKLNAIADNVDGQRIVLTDDSIVRGTTTRKTIRLLRDAGAREIHFRVTSPPYRWPCFYGVDTPEFSELLYNNFAESPDPIEGIRQYLGVDSLAYLDLDSLIAATGEQRDALCSACFTGEYPVRLR